MTLTHEDLPRKDGTPVGAYHLTHKLPDFAQVGWGFRFEAGKTVEPVGGRVALRLLYANGGEFTLDPADRETVDAILAHADNRGNTDRTRELHSLLDGMFAPAETWVSDEERAARELLDKALADAKEADEKAEREAAELAELQAAIDAEDAANAAQQEVTPAAAPAEAGVSSSGAAVPSSKPKDKGKAK